jgi:hypothetical protein
MPFPSTRRKQIKPYYGLTPFWARRFEQDARVGEWAADQRPVQKAVRAGLAVE